MAEKRGEKRKLVSHTIDFKLKVIAAVDKKDRSKTEICKEFNIANSTLSTFLRDRQKIEEAASKSTFQLSRKRMRLAGSEKDRDLMCPRTCYF
jgi:transposase-like protein